MENNTELTLAAALASLQSTENNEVKTENVKNDTRGQTNVLGYESEGTSTIDKNVVLVTGIETATGKADDILNNLDPVSSQETIGNLEAFSKDLDKAENDARIEYEKIRAREKNIIGYNEKKVNNSFKDNIIEMDDEEEKEIIEAITETPVELEPAIDLSSITIKKSKKLSEDDIFKKYMSKINEDSVSTRIVAVNSGYAASMLGFSSPALRNVSNELAQYDKDFGATDYRYRLVHSKIKDSTIGDMEYMQFLKNTSLLEIDILFYGIVCSTYPDKNQFPGKCGDPECGAKFKYDYYNKDYLKVQKENMDDVTERVADLLRGQAINPVEIFENAPTNMVTREILKKSGIIVDLRHPTLYDHLYDTLEKLEGSTSSLINSMPFIEAVYVPSDDGGYFKMESVEKKLNILETISEDDDVELAEHIKEIIDQSKIEFAMQNIECPYCKHKFPDQAVSMEQMLFTIHQIKITNK